MIAALYVLPDGPYVNLPDVDPWPEERDARLYDGPYPVVAHPPCARWGKYWFGGCVEQGHYGHRARKATWLYVCGVESTHLPELTWGPSVAKIRLDDGYHSAAERKKRKALRPTAHEQLTHRERRLTPEPFRDVLLDIAKLVNQ